MTLPAPELANVKFDASLPPMNREQLDMLLMTDDEEETNALAKELFEIYESESREKLKQIDGVCAARDAQGLRNIVHFIAGSAGNLGLSRLSAFYRAIEKTIDEGDFSDFERCPDCVRREFEESCRLFREEFGI